MLARVQYAHGMCALTVGIINQCIHCASYSAVRLLVDLLKNDAPIDMGQGGEADGDMDAEEGGGGDISDSRRDPLHFRVIQTLKNLAVRIPSAAASTNEANKRSMRFALPLLMT